MGYFRFKSASIMYYYRLISSMLKATVSTLLTGLYAVYKAENNANDSLLNYNGTAQGGLTYTAGKSGNAFTFNGTNAYVSLPNNSLNIPGDFSVSFWINAQSFPGGSYSVINSVNLSSIYYGWQIYLTANGITFDYYNGTTSIFSLGTGNLLTSNTWHHVSVVRKNNTGNKIYVNGTLAVSNTITTNPVSALTMYSNIGVAFFNGSYINPANSNTKIDEVNVWNKELTSTEVTDLYNAGSGKFYPY